MYSLLFGCLNKVFAIVLLFFTAEFKKFATCIISIPQSILAVTFRNFSSPTFEFQSPMIINMSFLDILLMVFSNSE